MSEKRKRLGDLLVEVEVLTPEKLREALQEQRTSHKRLGELLVDNGYCTEYDIAVALSTQLGLELLDLKHARIDPAVLQKLPEPVARKHLAIPVAMNEEGYLKVAFADPLNLDATADLQFATGMQIETCVALREEILIALDRQYRARKTEAARQSTNPEDLPGTAIQYVVEAQQDGADARELEKRGQSAPVVRMVNHLLAEAVEAKASDIHVEPERDKVLVRYRVDGHLREHLELPKWIQGAVTSRIKIMSQMDIAEKRVPQDGRIGLKVADHAIDLRISTLPTNFGEKIVIRLLDPAGMPGTLGEIGFGESTQKAFERLIRMPQGIILVTGPTGSGKTTTLYAALGQIKDVTKNVTTIEDPIEYGLEGINQVGINDKAGRTFASVLPAILRQDPDVVMVGEMRDVETATIAMQASLTGHLVLSTIHTNNAVATISRLRNLGVPAYLIASTISGILAQRLVRVVCEECKEPHAPTEAELSQVGLTAEQAKSLTFYHGRGCEACGHTGYVGRTAVYELMTMSPGLREHVAKDASEAAIRQLAAAEGMKTLLHEGLQKVFTGITSIGELARVTQMDGDLGALCPECNYGISAGFVVCPQCGTELVHHCSHCQAVVDASWAYCPYCARTLTTDLDEVRSRAELAG